MSTQEEELEKSPARGTHTWVASGTYFLRDVPLQPGGVRDVRVGVPFAVSILQIAQLKAVRGHDVLSGRETEMDRDDIPVSGVT